jgi:hypothetical protein
VRRFARRIAVVLLALGGLAGAVASPAAASGGGCFTIQDGAWNVGTCISQSGGYLLPDFYINAHPAYQSSCDWEMYIQTQYGEQGVQHGSCSSMGSHNGPWAWPWYQSAYYQARLEIYDGSATHTYYSPMVYPT